jgi:hypothetical protein
LPVKKKTSEEKFDVIQTIEFNESRREKHTGRTKLFKGKFLNEIQREEYFASQHENISKYTEA